MAVVPQIVEVINTLIQVEGLSGILRLEDNSDNALFEDPHVRELNYTTPANARDLCFQIGSEWDYLEAKVAAAMNVPDQFRSLKSMMTVSYFGRLFKDGDSSDVAYVQLDNKGRLIEPATIDADYESRFNGISLGKNSDGTLVLREMAKLFMADYKQ